MNVEAVRRVQRVVDALLPALALVKAEIDDVLRRFRRESGAAVGAFMRGADDDEARQNFVDAVAWAWVDVAYAAFADGGGDTNTIDVDLIADGQAAQIDYVGGLFEELHAWRARAAEGEAVAGMVERRLELWERGLVGWYNEWVLRGMVGRAAKAEKLLQWKLSLTEHCDTCLWLSEQDPQPPEWYLDNNYIPQVGGSNLDCGGWLCRCFLEDADGEKVTLDLDPLFENLGDDARSERERALGTDGGQYSDEERRVALRIERREGITLIRKDPYSFGEYDWDGSDGKLYDGVGPLPAGAQNNPDLVSEFIGRVDDHLRTKGGATPAIIAVDLEGFTPDQKTQIVEFIRTLPARRQDQILLFNAQ